MKFSSTDIKNSQHVRITDSDFSYDIADSFTESDYPGVVSISVGYDDWLSCIEVVNYGTQSISVTINGKTIPVKASTDYYSIRRIPFETEKFKDILIEGYENHEFSVDVYY
jgi:hypothetical protein